VPLLLLFVHRVVGLAPGLYAFCRDAGRLDWLRACAPRYQWQPVEAAQAAALPLFRLQAPEDVQEAARALSCQQDWAAKGCVALAIFAEYKPLLRDYGPWMYQRAHWEAGIVGQALYLAAESVGCSGTAMGCFFGPWTHQTMCVDAEQLQDVEHFTIGYAIEDRRVQTIPPYAHLAAFRALADRDAVNTGNEDKALLELQQTTRGTCCACGRSGTEGRSGTDEFEGQFYCGRCWASWGPRVRAAEAEEAKEDEEEHLRTAGASRAQTIDAQLPVIAAPSEFEAVD